MSNQKPLLGSRKRGDTTAGADPGDNSVIFRGDISMISKRSIKTATYKSPDVWDPDEDTNPFQAKDSRKYKQTPMDDSMAQNTQIYANDKKQSILTEPDPKTNDIITIPNMEEEQKQFKKKDIAQSSTQIFHDHCNQYATKNLIKNELKIKDFQFRYSDIERGLICSEVTDKMKMQNQKGISFKPQTLQDNAFAKLFKTVSMKLFTDFIFVDDKQYILVKTWQKVHYELPSHDNLPTKGIESMNQRMDFRAKGGSHAVANLNQNDDDADQQSFYIKTLQIFDKEGNELDDPILVEQVYGNFDSYRLYDISTLHYKDSLYYFKRIFINNDSKIDDEEKTPDSRQIQSPFSKADQDQKGGQLGSLTPIDGAKRSIGSPLDNYSDGNKAASQNQDSVEAEIEKQNLTQDDIQAPGLKTKAQGGKAQKKQYKTILQLYCYDLRKGIEKVVERVKIDEFLLPELDRQQAEQEANLRSQVNISEIRSLKQRTQDKSDNNLKQYNITFSCRFGDISEEEAAKEESEQLFLDNQFFCIQQYVMDRQQVNTFRIFKIADYSIESRFKSSMLYETKLKVQSEQNSDLNRQVQFVNHIITRGDQHDTSVDTIHFLVTNMFILIQIDIERKGSNKISPPTKEEQFPRKYTDLFQKIWNSGGIIPQRALINNNEDEREEADQQIYQYFFVDSRNEIQLLFPNTKQKVEYLRRVEQINEICKIKNTENMQKNQNFKKIMCIDYRDKNKNGADEPKKNVVQKIGHLKKILNHENMHQAQSLIYVRDFEGQTLYITEPASQVIIFFRMSVQNLLNSERCPEVLDSKINEENDNRDGGGSAQLMGGQSNQISQQMSMKMPQQKQNQTPSGAGKPAAQQRGQTQKGAPGVEETKGLELDKVKQTQVASEYCNIDNQMASQGTNSMQLEEETENRQKMTFITDLNHQEPYIQYKNIVRRPFQFMKSIADDEENQLVKLERRERYNHIFIDDFEGNKVKVKTYNSETTEYSTISQNLKLILYQLTHDMKYAMFLFGVYNVKMQGAGAQSEMKIIKKSYILVRKTKEELTRIFQSNQQEELIKKTEQVILIKSYYDMSYHGFNDIQSYQFDESEFNEEDPEQQKKQFTPFRDIELLLANGDGIEQDRLNFIPFIYQERLNGKSNMFVVFDIIQNKATQMISISPSQANLEYLYEDENGYNMFMLARCSEVELNQDSSSDKQFTQTVIYQVFNLYRERIGRIQAEEFLISHSPESTKIQTIGLKHLLFSKECMQAYSWEKIRDSKAVPYEDNGVTKGCTIQLKTHQDSTTNQDVYRLINLMDQDISNIYFMKTDVIYTGQKKFTFQQPSTTKNKDPKEIKAAAINPSFDLYLIVISTKFNRKYIELDLFDRSESYQCLNIAQELILRMRIPDLEYIVLNSFESLQEIDFFRSQLILQGKSICDICITDQKAVRRATNGYKENIKLMDDNKILEGSILEQIIQDDFIRRQALFDTRFYPSQPLVQIDLNFMGTIGRAFHQFSYQAVKTLLEITIEEIGTIEYHNFIMFDLNLILDSKQVQQNDFFSIDTAERKEGAEAACNLEILIKNNELPQFSDVPFEYFNLSNQQIYQSQNTKLVSNFLDLDNDLSQCIIERDQMKPSNIDRSFETEFFYIDYQMMIIDQKIRCIREGTEIPKFDDLYFAEIIMKKSKDEINNSFFLQESAQKIINAQWDRTKSFQKRIFFLYFFFYCIPMCVSCFKISDDVDNLMFNIAFFPSIMLLVIETIQLMKDGIDYFAGWNNLDCVQLLLFYFLFYLRLQGYDNDLSFFPLLKLMNILLAFAKMGFFVRIFEDYGFLVQMVIFVIFSLIPFTIVYGIFVVIFSICNVVLKLNIDEEVDEAQQLSYFQKTVLQTFRTGIGELGMPSFETVLEDEDTIYRSLNIYLIWILWFLTTFVLLIFMINFLIAVITSAYQRVMNYQKIISYKHKADLNYETYMLLSKFINLKEYRYLVLMSSSSMRELIEDEFDEKSEQFKKFIQRETAQLKESHKNLNDRIESIKKDQGEIEMFIHEQFDQLRSRRDNMQKEIYSEIERGVAQR